MDSLLSGIKRVHLVGIAGVGMTGLALILRERGFIVTGSDIAESRNVEVLRASSIKVYLGHSESNVALAELVCFSSAVEEDNVEVLRANKKDIPVMRRAQVLALLSQEVKTIAVAGSHGKTTTSAFIAFVLSKLGYDPNVFIGGIPLNFSKSAWTGKDFFVIEADESDGSFLFYQPWVSIITNIDSEHLDFYKDMKNLKNSFYALAHRTKSITIGCGDDENVRWVLKMVPHLKYGLSGDNRIRAENIKVSAGLTVFDLIVEGERFSDVCISLLGEHNVLNTLAAVSLCRHLGIDIKLLLPILREFKGVRRRFQLKAMAGGVKFVDDYAHHPREIEATLKAARGLHPKRLVAVFQPHRYSRVKLLCCEFAACFCFCDYLIVTDIYSAGEPGMEGIDGRFIFNEIKKVYLNSIVYIPRDRLAKEVPLLLEEGDLTVGLGAGDIHKLMDVVAAEFKRINLKNFAGVKHDS